MPRHTNGARRTGYDAYLERFVATLRLDSAAAEALSALVTLGCDLVVICELLYAYCIGRKVDLFGNLPTDAAAIRPDVLSLHKGVGDIKHAVGAAFDEDRARQFVDVLVGGLLKGLYAGWQESEVKRNDVVTDIKTLGDDDDFASLGISDNVNLVETLLKRLIQHYSIS